MGRGRRRLGKGNTTASYIYNNNNIKVSSHILSQSTESVNDPTNVVPIYIERDYHVCDKSKITKKTLARIRSAFDTGCVIEQYKKIIGI